MFKLGSRFRLSATAVLVALGAGFLPAAMAQSAVPAASGALPDAVSAPCSQTAAARDHWADMTAFLKRHGLVMHMQCHGDGQAQTQLQVLDALKASEVLRGPLADGEGVETGAGSLQALATADGDRQAVAPDVHFNRRWLVSAMAKHRVLQAEQGGDAQLSRGSQHLQLAAR